MSDDKNVVDFGARAALERSKRQGFLLNEIDGAVLKSIFDAAYVDCRLDSDGDCIVRDELTLFASADPARDVFKVSAFFWTTGTREQAVEFCQRFNSNLIVVKAQVRDQPDADGQWAILIDHDRLVFEEERIEPRTIVKLTRRFQFIVRNGITRYDQDKIF
jgi:hypothetical protein